MEIITLKDKQGNQQEIPLDFYEMLVCIVIMEGSIENEIEQQKKRLESMRERYNKVRFTESIGNRDGLDYMFNEIKQKEKYIQSLTWFLENFA